MNGFNFRGEGYKCGYSSGKKHSNLLLLWKFNASLKISSTTLPIVPDCQLWDGKIHSFHFLGNPMGQPDLCQLRLKEILLRHLFKFCREQNLSTSRILKRNKIQNIQTNITGMTRVATNSEYGPNTEYRVIRFLQILRIPNTELFVFWKWMNTIILRALVPKGY